ncbi:MAG: ribose 5-phosphate isomerase A, partial [Thermoprotei archaeon ex4572_64]
KIGTKVPIPIEVLPISWRWVASEIKSRFGGDVNLRVGIKGKRGPIITDNGNYILDWKYRGLDNPEEMEHNLKVMPGVVESGIFSNSKVHKIVIARSDSTITEL